MGPFIKRIEDVMPDSKVSEFFEQATGRPYTVKETCVNDIRRLLMLFYNQRLLQSYGVPTKETIIIKNQSEN